jgi:hypothetical protein
LNIEGRGLIEHCVTQALGRPQFIDVGSKRLPSAHAEMVAPCASHWGSQMEASASPTLQYEGFVTSWIVLSRWRMARAPARLATAQSRSRDSTRCPQRAECASSPGRICRRRRLSIIRVRSAASPPTTDPTASHIDSLAAGPAESPYATPQPALSRGLEPIDHGGRPPRPPVPLRRNLLNPS